jgi:signal peptidase II
MQLAGALGNVIDRLFFGGRVTDFISLGSFAVFNVADSSITVGVIILMIDVIIQEYKNSKRKPKNSSIDGNTPEIVSKED